MDIIKTSVNTDSKALDTITSLNVSNTEERETALKEDKSELGTYINKQ